MKLIIPKPNIQISEFVHSILVIEKFHVISPYVLPLYANGSPTLLFQTTKGKIKGSSNYLTLFGQTVYPDTLTMNEDFTLVAYFFKPFSLFSLFGVSAQELTDNPIDLNLIEPILTKILLEQLLNAVTINEMLNLIDNYICNLINNVKSDLQLIKFVTNRIHKNPNKEALQNVQKEIYTTERTFQRLFERNIGISPNQYRRICQFNSAFQQLQKNDFKNLSDIAFNNGYTDQSHFIRSFKEFTRITPKEYLNLGKQNIT